MEDTEKQCSQAIIRSPEDASTSQTEELDLHLIDFWEMLSELRI